MPTPFTPTRVAVMPLDDPIIEAKRRTPPRAQAFDTDVGFQYITDALRNSPGNDWSRHADPVPVDQTGFMLGGVRLS